MFSVIVRHSAVRMPAAAVLAAAAIITGGVAAADASQDQKFLDLLGQKDIPPVDNADSLMTTAKKACSKLDDGMPVGDLVELLRNNGFNENPLTRLQPQDRITRTIHRFISASVEAYCPYDEGKIAAIAGYEPRPDASGRIALVSFVGPLPTGEINPTKPLPVPAQPPPQAPQEIQPVPEQPPPPPRHAPPVPVPKQTPPPPEQPPPPAEAPQAPPPEAAPPAPAAPGAGGNAPAPAAPGGGGNAPAPGAPGGGAGGGNTPAPPTPDQPAPPGHIRLAP